MVIQGIRFIEVDNVEPIRNAFLHILHREIEPLSPLSSFVIWLQH